MWLKFSKSKLSDGTAFVSFWLPQGARNVLRNFEDLDTDLHMTVLFIPNGVDSEEDQQSILNAIEETADKYSPLNCRLEEIGIMKNDDHTIVANVNVKHGAEFYVDILRSIESHWQKFERKFDWLPHVSLKLENDDRREVALNDIRKYKWNADEISVQFITDGQKHRFKMNGKK